VGKAHFGPFNSEGEEPLNLGFDINIGGNSISSPRSYYGIDGFRHINGNKVRAVPGLEKYHGNNRKVRFPKPKIIGELPKPLKFAEKYLEQHYLKVHQEVRSIFRGSD